MDEMDSYASIDIGGGDTAKPINLMKRLAFIAAHVSGSHVKLLDCGCGGGEYVRRLRKDYAIDAHGVEYSEEKVAQAKAIPELAPHVARGNIEQLDFSDSSFDVVLLNEVLEHVPNDVRALREVHRVLVNEGSVIVFSPNRWYPFETHGVYTKSNRKLPPYVPGIPYIPVRIGNMYFSYWARNYWQSELRRMIRNCGFDIRCTEFFWQTFEGISGQQLKFVHKMRRPLRWVANLAEKTPLVKRFGVSQVIVADKQS